MGESSSRTASAPIMAVKVPWPYFSRALRYSSSVSICLNSRSVLPGSVTT